MMLRRIAAVLIGLIIGSVCITGVEKIGHSLYPPPVGAKDGDMESLKAYVAEALLWLCYSLFWLMLWLHWFPDLQPQKFPMTGNLRQHLPVVFFFTDHHLYDGFLAYAHLVLGSGNFGVGIGFCRSSTRFKN